MSSRHPPTSKELANIRALVTTKWTRGYTQRMISNVESFYVDSSIDNDADSWQLELGDPTGEFLPMLERNNEVRVRLVSSTPGAAGHIFTGIADDISYDNTGVLTTTGRDYASLALDSTCPPVRFKHVKAKYVIANQARKLGFDNISLAMNSQVKKTIKTDGSETYWEFWYRLYRNEKMYLWVGPDGALIGSRLNFSDNMSYYFGTPQKTDTLALKARYISVDTVEIRKSTQGRVGEVWVLVKDGKNTYMVKDGMKDPTMAEWKKRPFKIIQDTVSHSQTAAKKRGWEEIFEGKVGSFEIRITVADPKQLIRPNRMCQVRIPEIGLYGQFYIIGWRMQADSNGWVQEIRLRERYIAMSRRVPAEPKIDVPKRLPKTTTVPGSDKPDVAAEEILAGLIPGAHSDWGDFFYKATLHFQDGWDGDLFLATLLGICSVETGFLNERENTGHYDHEEWREKPTAKDQPPAVHGQVPGQPPVTVEPPSLDSLVKEWQDTFMNEVPQVNVYGLGELGVGPMQLTTRSLKIAADDYYSTRTHKPVNHSQYDGGRWDPESNIYSAAEYFASCLRSTGLSPSDGDQQSAMFQAAGIYHAGAGGAAADKEIYAKKVRHAVLIQPGFLATAREVIAALRANSRNSADGNTEGTTGGKLLPVDWPSEAQCLAAFTSGSWIGSGKAPEGPAGLPTINFIQAKYYNEGRLFVNYIVIHDMEAPETNKTAENIANMFAAGNTEGPASAHYCIDNQSIWQCVKDKDTSYGVIGVDASGASINASSLQFEHAGYASQTSADWSDPYSTEMLRLSAKLTARKAKQYGVPIQHCTPAMLALSQHGFVGHGDFTAAFGPSGGHTDPGSNFPWATYMQMVSDEAAALT